jgi:hypothetical protein
MEQKLSFKSVLGSIMSIGVVATALLAAAPTEASAAASDQYAIRPVHSDKCLDVWEGSQANGAYVRQYGCHFGTNQRFRLDYRGSGEYAIRPVHSDKCLDVWEGSQANGAYVRQYDCHFGTNQRFWLDQR